MERFPERTMRVAVEVDGLLIVYVVAHRIHYGCFNPSRLFEELRTAYKQESGNIKGKLHAARNEKKNLAEKLTDTSAYLHRLNGQVSGLKGSLRYFPQ